MAENTLAQQTFCLLVQEESSKKFWRPEIAIWRLKILVQSPVGANIKRLISDPEGVSFCFCQAQLSCLNTLGEGKRRNEFAEWHVA